MPATFPSAAKAEVDAVNATTGGATTFASRLVTVLNRFFGANNVFGTAATRDVWTGGTGGAGDIPLLDADGRIPSEAMPPALATRYGAVRLATGLTDNTLNAVVTAAQLQGATSGIMQGFRASVVGISVLALNNLFTTPGPGFLIAWSGGQGGRSSSGNAGRNGESIRINYGITDVNARTGGGTITVQGGGAQTGTNSIDVVTLDAAAVSADPRRAPVFAIIRSGKGARGGRSGSTSGQTTSIRDGLPGDELLAFYDRAGIHNIMSMDGSGGTAGAGGRAGEAGKNGFAIFVRTQ